MTKTKIEWADESWNPLRGCSRVSEGCTNCYAETLASRFSGPGQWAEGFATRSPARWTGKVSLVESKLTDPLHWRKPRRVFVNSMSDLFHEKADPLWIKAVFGVMLRCPQHTFLVLTKRPKLMRGFMREAHPADCLASMAVTNPETCKRPIGRVEAAEIGENWPPKNVQLGVSVEDQATADARIPILLSTPAAVRFVSAEPLLGPVELRAYVPHDFNGEPHCPWCEDCVPHCPGGGDRWRATRLDNHGPFLDQVIVGGESGPGARPCEVDWIRSTVRQCKATAVPCFVKQAGAHVIDRGVGKQRPDGHCWPPTSSIRLDPETPGRILLEHAKGGDPAEWPEDLRVRDLLEDGH